LLIIVYLYKYIFSFSLSLLTIDKNLHFSVLCYFSFYTRPACPIDFIKRILSFNIWLFYMNERKEKEEEENNIVFCFLDILSNNVLFLLTLNRIKTYVSDDQLHVIRDILFNTTRRWVIVIFNYTVTCVFHRNANRFSVSLIIDGVRRLLLFLFTQLSVRDKQKAYIHSYMCLASIVAVFLFGEVKRKEKEIGRSCSLHPPSVDFFRVLWIIINIIHRAEKIEGLSFRDWIKFFRCCL
jgi:hypothetical protein